MLTAAQLKLTQPQLDALIKTRDLLAKGVVQHDENDIATEGEEEIEGGDQDPSAHPLFNMSVSVTEYSCGSICCIGGNMKLIEMGVNLEAAKIELTRLQSSRADYFVTSHQPFALGDPKSKTRGGNPGLTALFFPREIGSMDRNYLDVIDDWHLITPAAAVDAINNYLETGNPNWEQVGREHGLNINETYLELKREAGL